MVPSEQTVVFQGRTFRVDACGFFYELVAVPLNRIRMCERDQDMQMVTRYAQMYRGGSPFPPISLAGPTPDEPFYHICNGHHRFLAAQMVHAATIPAWVSFYVAQQGANGTYWALARMSNTGLGRALAAHLGRRWCPQCGTFLNYRAREGRCLSCGYTKPVEVRQCVCTA